MRAEVFFFEREHAGEAVDPFADFFHASFAPGPELRGDVIEDWNVGVMGDFGEVEVKGG